MRVDAYWNRSVDLCQHSADVINRAARQRIFGKWTVLDVAKVVAGIGFISLGLNYVARASFAKAWGVAKWYREVYRPLDRLILSSTTISAVFYVYKRFCPKSVDFDHAKQMGADEFLHQHRATLLQSPKTSFERKIREQLLEILSEKIGSDRDEEMHALLENWWDQKMGVTADIAQSKLPEFLSKYRVEILTMRTDVPWQKKIRDRLLNALIEKCEGNQEDLRLLDNEELLKHLIYDCWTEKNEITVDKTVGELCTEYERLRKELPWEKRGKAIVLGALANKVRSDTLCGLEPELARELREFLLEQPIQEIPVPFMVKALGDALNPAETWEREIEYRRGELQSVAILHAQSLRDQSRVVETAQEKIDLLTEAARWCISVQDKCKGTLDNEFHKELIEVKRALCWVLAANQNCGRSSNTESILVRILLHQEQYCPKESDLLELPWIFDLSDKENTENTFLDSNERQDLQQVVAIACAHQWTRLFQIEDGSLSGVDEDRRLKEIQDIEASLELLIRRSVVPARKIAMCFADYLGRTGIRIAATRQGYRRERTDSAGPGWQTWGRHLNPRARIVYRFIQMAIINTPAAQAETQLFIESLRNARYFNYASYITSGILACAKVYDEYAGRDSSWDIQEDLASLVAQLIQLSGKHTIDINWHQDFRDGMQKIGPARLPKHISRQLSGIFPTLWPTPDSRASTPANASGARPQAPASGNVTPRDGRLSRSNSNASASSSVR